MRPSTLAIAAILLLPIAAQARGEVDIDSIPCASDEPALAGQVESQLSLGFADRSDARAAGKGSGGAMTFSEETPNGRSLPLSIDPMSGEVLSK